MNANEHYCIDNSTANKGFRGTPGRNGKAGTPGKQGNDGNPGSKGPKGSSKVDIQFQQAFGNSALPYAVYQPKGTGMQIVRHTLFPGTTAFGSNLSTFKIGLGIGTKEDLAGWTFQVRVYFRERKYIGFTQSIKELLNTPTANATGTSQNYLAFEKTFNTRNKGSVLPTVIKTQGNNNPGTYINVSNLSATPEIYTIELEVVPISAPNNIEIWTNPLTWASGTPTEEVANFDSVRELAAARKAKETESFRTKWGESFDAEVPRGPVLSKEAVRALSKVSVYLYSAEYF